MATTIGECCQVFAGSSAPQDKAVFVSEGIPFVRAGSLENLCSGGSLDDCEQINREIGTKLKLRLAPAGTILFAKSGMSAMKDRVYCLPREAYVVSHLAGLIPSESVDSRYLAYWFLINPPSRLINDSAYPSIRLSDISKVKFDPPSLNEQKRIAAILDKANEIQQTSGSVPQQIEMILRSEFDSRFGDPVLNQNSWDEVKLESLLETMIDYRGKTPPKSDSGIPLLSAANITNHKIDLSHEQYISQEDYEKWTVRGFTQPGDVLITTEAPVGQVALYPENGIYQISRRMMALRPDSDRMNSVFLYFVLSHQNWQKRLTRILRGSTVPRVLKPDLLEQRVILPPIEIQRDFALFVNKMYSLNQLAEEKMESNTNLCNSMIQLLNPMT